MLLSVVLGACSGAPARMLFHNTLTETCRQQCWEGRVQAETMTECLKRCDPPR
jgi:hypothetical protein